MKFFGLSPKEAFSLKLSFLFKEYGRNDI
jgi:hypothetical protein